MSENKGEVYCDKCHKRLFGIAGYGFGQGAGALATDSAGKGKREGTEIRCYSVRPGAGDSIVTMPIHGDLL